MTGPVWRGLRSLSLGWVVRGPMERHIRIQGRLQEIAWTLKPDIAVLTGTRIRLPAGSSHTVQRLAGYTAVHFGWGHGCHTNRSTGVCFLLGKRFSTSYDQGSQFPSDFCGGTGGAMRLKGGTTDLGILAYYSPPFGGCSGARRKVQLTASRQLMDWMRTRLSSWPSRFFTIAAGDLNSGVETFRDGTQADCASVGEFQNASQNEAGDNFVEMSLSLELGILNTLWRTGGPTYCGVAAHRSNRPHFGAIVWFGMRKESCNMLEVGSQASGDPGCPPT